MFEYLSDYRTVIVTGPHRSGTTIAAAMIAADTSKACYREESFAIRDITKAEKLIRSNPGVYQGPYLLPWVPHLSRLPSVAVVYMDRSAEDVELSNQRLRNRKISAPHFSKSQADALWGLIQPVTQNAITVNYSDLEGHPLFVRDRSGFRHRQVSPGNPEGR